MEKQNHLSLHLTTILTLLLAACGGQVTSDAAGQDVMLTVSPATARIGPGESLVLNATVTGTANTMVEWSVQEGIGGGTVEPDGRYTAPATNGTYHVLAASSADPTKSATATVTVSPPPDGAPMNAANRISGVAPLAVFFDAVDTTSEGATWPFVWTSGVMQPSDMEGAHFSWDFGDPGSGSWSTTGKSKNTATGYTAAHVFETPGTYTVSLAVTDTAGTVATYVQTITVSAFSGTTHWASAAGTGDGTSEATPSSFSAGWSWVNAGANRRLLLKRGDTFSVGDSPTTTSHAGNVVGAYAVGDRPVIRFGGAGQNFYVQAADWRFMDLDLVGPGAGVDTSTGAIELAAHVKTDNVLVLRVRSSGFRVGLGNSVYSPIYDNPHDGVAWVDCEVLDGSSNCIYTRGRRLAIMGCNLHGSTSHVVRVENGLKAVVSNNRLWTSSGVYQHALKLHGWKSTDGHPETRWVTITDNHATMSAPWTISIGPQNAQSDERVSHVVVERNHTYGDPGTGRNQAGVEISSRQIMVRNNVFEGTGGASTYTGVNVMRRGVEPAPRDVRVLNNTVVRADPVGSFYGLKADSGAENVTYRNNLACAPLAGSSALVSGTPGAGFASDHNLLTSAEAFAGFSIGDFALQAASPAVDAGADLPAARTDYLGVPRPRGSAYDLGAFESR